MRLKELLSNAGSVGSAFAATGWEVVSLDSDPETDAQIHEDILNWDHTIHPPGHFDVCVCVCVCVSVYEANSPLPMMSSLAVELEITV